MRNPFSIFPKFGTERYRCGTDSLPVDLLLSYNNGLELQRYNPTAREWAEWTFPNLNSMQSGHVIEFKTSWLYNPFSSHVPNFMSSTGWQYSNQTCFLPFSFLPSFLFTRTAQIEVNFTNSPNSPYFTTLLNNICHH